MMKILTSRLEAHEQWLTSAGAEGAQFFAEDELFEGLDLQDTDFSEAIMPGATFRNCNLGGARFGSANLASVTFDRCDVSNASFVKATLDYAEFVDCTAENTSFFRSSLYAARFSATELDTANLEKAFVEDMACA